MALFSAVAALELLVGLLYYTIERKLKQSKNIVNKYNDGSSATEKLSTKALTPVAVRPFTSATTTSTVIVPRKVGASLFWPRMHVTVTVELTLLRVTCTVDSLHP